MKLIQGSLNFDHMRIVYDIVLLDKCVYIYFGTDKLNFDSLAYAIKTPYEEEPTAVTLIPSENNKLQENIAERLSTSSLT